MKRASPTSSRSSCPKRQGDQGDPEIHKRSRSQVMTSKNAWTDGPPTRSVRSLSHQPAPRAPDPRCHARPTQALVAVTLNAGDAQGLDRRQRRETKRTSCCTTTPALLTGGCVRCAARRGRDGHGTGRAALKACCPTSPIPYTLARLQILVQRLELHATYAVLARDEEPHPDRGQSPAWDGADQGGKSSDLTDISPEDHIAKDFRSRARSRHHLERWTSERGLDCRSEGGLAAAGRR